MKKSLLSLVMLLTGVGVWAQEVKIVGLTSIPTTATVPADITTGYYLLKEVNPKASGKPGGYLKAASEVNGAVVTPQGNTTLTVENTDNTYIWYIEKNEENSTYTIATANKVAAWQAPWQRQTNLVTYASKATLTFTTDAVTLSGSTATPIENSFIVQNEAQTACVHYSGNNLGSWNDANPASVMMFMAYQIEPTDLVREDPEIAAIQQFLDSHSGSDMIVGSYTTAAFKAIQDAMTAYRESNGTKQAVLNAFNTGEKVSVAEGDIIRIKSADARRGYLVYSTVDGKGSETNPYLAASTQNTNYPTSLQDKGVYSEWAFVEREGQKYLYNVQKQEFLKPASDGVVFEFTTSYAAVYSREDKGDCMYSVKFGNMYMEFSPGFGGHLGVRQISHADDIGSWFQIEKAGTQVSEEIRAKMTNLSLASEINAWKENVLPLLGHVGGYAKELQTAIEAISTIAEKEDFINEHSVISMVPGYYYIKGTGTGNQATWYATYNDNRTKFQAMDFDEDDKIKFVWKFEGVDNGYKMLSCNLNKYATLENAAANGGTASALVEGWDYGHKFVLTDNGSGKFTIVNGDNWIMRTENGGAINYWSGEGSERWYLIPVPAEDLAMEVTIGTAGYSSAFLPVDVTLPEGLNAYIVEETTTNSAKLTPINDIAAHQGVILNGTAGLSYTLNVGTATSDFSNNKLKGSIFDTYVADEAYVLATKEGNAGFYKAMLNKDENGNEGTTHFKNNARKAYLPVSADGARFLLFDFGTETGIEDINSPEDGNTGNAAIYDLSGRRVQKAQKGIYIVNGKKVIK